MVPRKFNIVEFNGFDLAGQYGEALPGIYDAIVDAHWNCVYLMCFGLKFGGFDIAPQYMIPEMFSDHIMLNGIISIDQNDVITIPRIEPPGPVILPATFEENGTFYPPSGVGGYSPVVVDVSGEAYAVSYYVNSILLEKKAFLPGDTAPKIVKLVENSWYYYPEIQNVQADMHVELLPLSTNFEIRQLYFTDCRLTVSGDDLTDLTIDNIDVTGLSGRYGIVFKKLGANNPTFVAKANSGNRQYGKCSATATMPSILNSGTGRTWYSTYTENAQTTITNATGVDYFIETASTGYITIKNYFAY